MEKLIQKELTQNARKILDQGSSFSPSYEATRNLALTFFEDNKIPTKKHENWLYTNIAKTLAPRFAKQSEEKDYDKQYVIHPSNALIFNNGTFNVSNSSFPDSIKIEAPKVSIQFHDVFDALNLSVATDAITFKIGKNAIIEKPITLLHMADENGVNKQISPRINFNIQENVNVTIVEVFTSAQNDLFQYTTNAHTSFNVGKNSKVTHIKLNLEAKLSTHISLTHAEIARDATFNTYSFDLGNLLTRNNLEVHLNDENSNAGVHGLYNLKQTEHADIFSSIFHHSPHSFSEQLYKGVLNQESHGAFTGKIVIDVNAIGVNSSQLNKNLLLSKKAHINTRPQLLVSADDVKCSHGATIGELSNEEEFYLLSRGISSSRARKMLALGFAYEVLFKVDNTEVFNFVNKFLEKSEF